MSLLKSLFSINPASLTLGTILFVVMLFFSGTPILDLIELKTYDLRFLSRGQMPPSPAVVMALVDEKSLATEGRWPWPRSTPGWPEPERAKLPGGRARIPGPGRRRESPTRRLGRRAAFIASTSWLARRLHWL